MLHVPMRRTSLLVALFVWMQVGVSPNVAAQPAARPTIQTVTLPEGTGLLIITGTGFGPNAAVTVEGQPATVLPGGSDTQLTVLAPAAVLTTPGTYRLTVTDTVRQIADVFVIASHARSGASVVAASVGMPAAAPSGASRVAALSASSAAGTSIVHAPDNVVTLTGYEDSGNPFRTAVGYQALFNNDTGTANTARGYQVLYSNTSGNSNTASGMFALYANTTGSYNTASGHGALFSNVPGSQNTASGYDALFSNTSGSLNTASGFQALYSNSLGTRNTASGHQALFATTGSSNTALGLAAGANVTTGSSNLLLGANVLGTAADTNTIRIGLPYDGSIGQNQTFIAGIYGTTINAGVPVVISANGQLGTIGPGNSGGGTSPLSGAANTAAVAQLQQQVRDQQITIADLNARLGRLEALLKPTVGRQ